MEVTLRDLGFDEKKRNAIAEIKAPTTADVETSAKSREFIVSNKEIFINEKKKAFSRFFAGMFSLLCSSYQRNRCSGKL